MIVKIYVVDHGERYYLRDWIIANGTDHLVFTAVAKHALRFKSKQAARDYMYQMQTHGYEPHMEVI